MLSDYLKRAKIASDKHIFPLTRQMVYYIVRDAANKADMGGMIFLNPTSGKKHYIHPHDLRSALAVSWLEIAGGDASKQKALQDHLGHTSFDTTQRYNKLSPSKIRSIGDEVREKRFGGKNV
jgi:integrase